MINTLIFDVYGTILDTRSCSLVVLQDIIDKCGCKLKSKYVYEKWRKEIEKMILFMNTEKKFKTEKVFFKIAMERAFNKLKINASAHGKSKLYSELCWGHRSIFPDTLKAMKNLGKNYKIVLASNSDTKPMMADIKRYKINADNILCSEMLKIYKPHKLFFQKVLKRISKTPKECVYVGDSLTSDISPAHKLGMKTIWVNRKSNKISNKGKKPDFIVNDLLEIENALA